MRARTATWLVVMVLTAPLVKADETAAADPLSLTSGDRVRLRVAGSGGSLRGTIESVTVEDLVLRPQGTAEPLQLSLAQLQSLEVARGRRSQWGKGAVIGAVSGALLFGLVGASLECSGVYDCSSSRAANAAILGLVGGVAGGSVGALVGLAFKTDRWVAVDQRKPKVALLLAPARGQVRFGLSVRF